MLFHIDLLSKQSTSDQQDVWMLEQTLLWRRDYSSAWWLDYLVYDAIL